MVERKLRSRRRKFSKGRLIRVSDLVYETLDKQRSALSWDCLLRKQLGLPDRAGNEQPLVEGMLETMTGLFVLRMPGTHWYEIEDATRAIAAKAAKKRSIVKAPPPIRMRELR